MSTVTCPIFITDIGMMMSKTGKEKLMLEDLFTEIERLHTFELTDNISEIDEFEKICGYKIPEDLKEFYRRYKTVKLFDDKEWGATYRFVPISEMKNTGYDIYGDSANPNEFFWPRAWFTVCDVLDGNFVAVDLSPQNEESYNYIDCFHETYGIPGESQVIAKSFRELLEQSLKNGDQQYYLKEDFKGYGDALEINPETAMFRISNEHDLTVGGWMVDFVRDNKSFRKYFDDKVYGNKQKSYDAAKQYIEGNKD